MKLSGLLGLGLLAVPHLASAADLGPLADLGWIGPALTGIGYMLGGVGVVYSGVGAISAYNDRDIGGLGHFWWKLGITVVGAILVGVIVPRLVAPIMALGATL